MLLAKTRLGTHACDVGFVKSIKLLSKSHIGCCTQDANLDPPDGMWVLPTQLGALLAPKESVMLHVALRAKVCNDSLPVQVRPPKKRDSKAQAGSLPATPGGNHGHGVMVESVDEEVAPVVAEKAVDGGQLRGFYCIQANKDEGTLTTFQKDLRGVLPQPPRASGWQLSGDGPLSDRQLLVLHAQVPEDYTDNQCDEARARISLVLGKRVKSSLVARRASSLTPRPTAPNTPAPVTPEPAAPGVALLMTPGATAPATPAPATPAPATPATATPATALAAVAAPAAAPSAAAATETADVVAARMAALELQPPTGD